MLQVSAVVIQKNMEYEVNKLVKKQVKSYGLTSFNMTAIVRLLNKANQTQLKKIIKEAEDRLEDD